MKKLSILMLLVVIASLFGTVYVYLTANISVTGTGIAMTEAVSQQQVFDVLKEQVRDDAVVGTAYTKEVPGDSANYKFITYRVRLKNNTFLKAENVELQITPRDGDVLQIAPDIYGDLEAHSEEIFEATILADINQYAGREIYITYYLWGKPFQLRAVCND